MACLTINSANKKASNIYVQLTEQMSDLTLLTGTKYHTMQRESKETENIRKTNYLWSQLTIFLSIKIKLKKVLNHAGVLLQ